MTKGHVGLAGCSVECDGHVGDTDCRATGPPPLWRAVGRGARQVPAVLVWAPPCTCHGTCPLSNEAAAELPRTTPSPGRPVGPRAGVLTHLSLPLYSAASSSMRGAIMRQGPHQGAQKSMSTGTLLLRTSSSNVSSLTGGAASDRRMMSTRSCCHQEHDASACCRN